MEISAQERRQSPTGPHLVRLPERRPTVSINLLGPVVVLRQGLEVQPEAAKQQALLAALALNAGTVVHTGALIDELWSHRPPRTAANSLQTYVSRLRSRLGGATGDGHDLVRTHASGYELTTDRLVVDAARFEDLVGQGRDLVHTDPASSRDVLAQALALWRGPALGGLEIGAMLRLHVDRLEELRLTATCERLALDLELGDHAAAVTELAGAVATHPLRERFSELLMTALYRSGRQAEALEAYRNLRSALVEELGVEPGPDVRALHSAMLSHDPSLDAGGPPGRGSALGPATGSALGGPLPEPLTGIVGRDTEVMAISELLADARLVTLTGAGGCGKTRLALAAAGRARPGFPHGACFVELGCTDDPDLVPRAVMAALGLADRPDRSPTDGLTEVLRHRRFLLVLDNCEHLIDAVARLVDRLVTSCHGLHVIATSREALRIPGETTFAVQPLGVPPESRDTAADIADIPAVRLFAERAATARPGFAVSDAEAPAVARICRTLDGIPLALELAASRLTVLDVDGIAERLEDRFGLLVDGSRTAPDRHRTLRAAVDWSHDLLTDGERSLFARLSVFAGSFPLEAVRAICADESVCPTDADSLDCMAQLAAKSLVVVTSGRDGVRYRLLETLRAYGREQLVAAGDSPAHRRRHAGWYLDRVRTSEAGLRSPDHEHWLQRLWADHDNVRAALSWALESGDAGTALELAAALWWFWFATGQVQEGHRWTCRALELAEAAPGAPERLHAHMRHRAAHLSWTLGDLAAAEADARRALAYFEHTGDHRDLADATAVLGFVAQERGDPAAGVARLRDALAHYRLSGDNWCIGAAAVLLGTIRLEAGQDIEAAELVDESLRRFTVTGDAFGMAWARWGMGKLAAHRGDTASAAAWFKESLAAAHDIGHVVGVGLALTGLARVATQAGGLTRAARLFAAVAVLAQATGVPFTIRYGSGHERAVADVRAGLGAADFDRTWAQGRSMSLEQATTYALASRTDIERDRAAG